LDLSLVGIIAVIALALAFDYTNGFHDAATRSQRWYPPASFLLATR